MLIKEIKEVPPVGSYLLNVVLEDNVVHTTCYLVRTNPISVSFLIVVI